MTVYLVDFENVRSAGLKGVENLDEDDKVIIFYSKNADAITFDVHMLLSKSRAEIETYMIIRGGRNSLDFQLSTYLGYLVMENRYRNIVIISADKGFLCAINFWDENKELCNAHITMSKSVQAFVSNEPDDDLENDMLESKFIEKVSVLPPKNMFDIKETVRLNDTQPQEESTSNEKSKFDKSNESKLIGVNQKDNREKQEIKNDRSYFDNIRTDRQKIHNYYENRNENRNGNRNENGFQRNSRPENTRFKTNRTEGSQARSTNQYHYNGRLNSQKPDNSSDKEKFVIELTKRQPDRLSTKAVNKARVALTAKHGVEPKKKGAPQIQNPTSKNKIFAAEVKLNITDDVREIVGEKYGEEYVPVLVEAIGKSTGKQHLYRMLVSRLGQDVGKDIYMMIKGQYANLKRK